MITQRAMNYAKVLESLDVPMEDVQKVKTLFQEVAEVSEVLSNPLVLSKEKQNIIKALFPEKMWNFMRLLCEHNAVTIWSDIIETYEELDLERQNKVKATLSYAMKMDDEDIEQVKDMICKKYNKAGVELDLVEDPTLISGMVLKVKDTEFDKSVKGTLEELQKTLVRR